MHGGPLKNIYHLQLYAKVTRLYGIQCLILGEMKLG